MERAVVRHLEPHELLLAAGVAARALRDAPTTVASHGDDPLVRMARNYRSLSFLLETLDSPQLVAVCGSCPVGLAAVTAPGRCVGVLFRSSAVQLLARPVPELGDPAREQVFWARWAERDPLEDHWHVGPVGVEPGFQGMGIGSSLMRRLCSDFDSGAKVGWLETDKEQNVRFYASLGFEVVHEETVLEVPTWYMRREPSPR